MYNYTNGICFLQTQAACKCVVSVAQFFGKRIYFFSCVGADGGVIVERATYCSRRNAKLFSNVVNGYFFVWLHLPFIFKQ